MLIYKGKLERFAAKRSQIQGHRGDEQGITLQTLIVTAVLVLMAVAAGVIIVAITNSSSDDLEEQSQDLDAKCAPWELHDLELEAIGAGGGSQYISNRFRSTDVSKAGRGGVTSTKVGCLPVCYLRLNHPGDRTLDNFLEEGSSVAPATDGSDLWLDNGNDPPSRGAIRIGVTYARRKYTTAYATEMLADDDSVWLYSNITPADNSQGRFQVGTHPIPRDAGSKLMVRVSDNKESCVIEDTSTSEIVYPEP